MGAPDRPGGLPRIRAGARPGRAIATTAVVAGLGLLATAVVAACTQQPPGPAGASAAAALASATPSAAPASSGPPPAPAVVAPAQLRIDALRLNARVDPVGVDASGDFAVPPSVDRVGWYRFGPGFSATTGSIVIAGHVDSAAEGDGAFFRLGSLDAGDVVTLSGPGSRTRAFRVVARERYRKTAIPLEKYFARDGAARLTLITCGGPFDSRTRHYRDNVVITAVPAPS